MKILHLTPWQEPCGIAGYAADLVGALEQQGVRNEIHALNRRGRLYPLAEEVRAELDRVCRRAREHDLIHVQHEFSFFCDAGRRVDHGIDHFGHLLAGLKRVGKPVVVTFHTEPAFLHPLRHLATGINGLPGFCRSYLYTRVWRRRVQPFFRQQGPCVAIVHTDKARASFADTGFDSAQVYRIPIGLTPRAERVNDLGRRRAREQLGYADDAVVLSLFGFISTYKGARLAATALAQLPPHYHLAIVGGPHPQAAGDDTLNRILKMAARVRALQPRLRVTGFLPPETVDLYHAATDICLAPYHNFNLSASAGITWALTSGRPVVASKIPPFLELQDEAECLLLFTESARYELAWQIERLAADRLLQERLVRNANAYAERHCWTNVAGEVLGIYSSLLGEPASFPVVRPGGGGLPADTSPPRFPRAVSAPEASETRRAA